MAVRDYRVSPPELTVRATTSNDIQFVLQQGTAGVNLSSFGTVELWLKDKSGGTQMTDNLTGNLSINGSAGGSVKWTPGTGVLKSGSSPYAAYFKVYEGAAKFAFYPEGYDLTVTVRETYT